MLIVFTTLPEKTAADVLAEMIVEAKLAACVQILPQMTSIYRWEGSVMKEPEHLLLIKTVPEKWDELRDFITANHSYSVPEIVAVRAEDVADPYLKWLNEAVS